MDFARRTRKSREMDMTPLIDIVFQLVIFFMLTTSFVASESLELTLPSLDAKAISAATAEPMRVQIEASGHVTIDGVAVDRARLDETLQGTISRNPDAGVGVYTTPGVSVQQLVTLLDLVYRYGGTQVHVNRLEFAGAKVRS
jgi:biopolymer transport protein ExbD